MRLLLTPFPGVAAWSAQVVVNLFFQLVALAAAGIFVVVVVCTIPSAFNGVGAVDIVDRPSFFGF